VTNHTADNAPPLPLFLDAACFAWNIFLSLATACTCAPQTTGNILFSPVGFPCQAAWNVDVHIEINTRREVDGAQRVCFRHQPQVRNANHPQGKRDFSSLPPIWVGFRSSVDWFSLPGEGVVAETGEFVSEKGYSACRSPQARFSMIAACLRWKNRRRVCVKITTAVSWRNGCVLRCQ